MTNNSEEYCRICGQRSFARHYLLREMFFGTREKFSYFQCSNCECIQIREPPTDIARFYPATYYSFGAPNWVPPRLGTLKRLAKKIRLDLFMFLRRTFPTWTFPLAPDVKDHVLGRLIGKKFLRAGYRILDVGCGHGQRLLSWCYSGFVDLSGIDPNTPATRYENGVRIYADWTELENQQFDFVMLNHSLEHIYDQHEVMGRVHRCLKPGHFAMIRIPVCTSDAWKHYEVNWVQLDAPRHFYIHSTKSLEILAMATGFALTKIEFDSSEFQFWASEQYMLDIPLNDARSYVHDKTAFPSQKIAEFKTKAERLNHEGRGDQAIFYLQRLPRSSPA